MDDFTNELQCEDLYFLEEDKWFYDLAVNHHEHSPDEQINIPGWLND